MTKQDSNTIPTNKKRKPTAKKNFSLSDFKKKTKYDSSVKFKPVRWLPVENVLGKKTFMEATGLNGFIANEATQIFGHTDAGKSLLTNEVAYSCQKNGVLPVFIITELKFSWEHLKMMGFEYTEVVDEETGEITYDGEFIFMDRSQFNSIEEMGDRIMQLLDFQKNGDLPRDLCFIIDSIGTIQSDLSLKSNKSNNEWDAGAISRVFGKGVIPRINLCKKDGYPHDNWLIIVNQVWVRIQFGNITNSGTSLLKVKKNGKEVVYATRTKVTIQKNHATGISLTTKLIATPHGFIEDSPADAVAKKYFKDHADVFLDLLGGGDVNDVEFDVENNEAEDVDYKSYQVENGEMKQVVE
jgi:hypothetical protein